MSTLPRRFRQFVTPAVRRVYLDTAPLAVQAEEHAALTSQVEDLVEQVDDLTTQAEDLSQQVKDLTAQAEGLSENVTKLERGSTRHAKDMCALQNQLRAQKAETERIGRELARERGLRRRLENDFLHARRRVDEEYADRKTAERHTEEAEKAAADLRKRQVELGWTLKDNQRTLEKLARELLEEKEAHRHSCEKWRLDRDMTESRYEERRFVHSVGSNFPKAHATGYLFASTVANTRAPQMITSATLQERHPIARMYRITSLTRRRPTPLPSGARSDLYLAVPSFRMLRRTMSAGPPLLETTQRKLRPHAGKFVASARRRPWTLHFTSAAGLAHLCCRPCARS